MLANLGYEGERHRLILQVKKTKGTAPTVDQKCYNALHGATRILVERGNALLKITSTALRHVSLGPDRIRR